MFSVMSHLSVCRGLADTKHTGKLNREQFSLAMYLIQQKTSKGIDPPSTLTPDMIPPSERTATAVGVPVSPAATSSLFSSSTDCSFFHFPKLIVGFWFCFIHVLIMHSAFLLFSL